MFSYRKRLRPLRGWLYRREKQWLRSDIEHLVIYNTRDENYKFSLLAILIEYRDAAMDYDLVAPF